MGYLKARGDSSIARQAAGSLPLQTACLGRDDGKEPASCTVAAAESRNPRKTMGGVDVLRGVVLGETPEVEAFLHHVVRASGAVPLLHTQRSDLHF